MTLPPADERAAELPSLGPPDPAAEPRGRGRLLALLAVLVVVGVELGLLGAFLTGSTLSVSGATVPVGPVVGFVVDVAAGIWAIQLTGMRPALLAPAVGWLAAVLPLSSSRPEGDLVITNSGKGLAFLLLGALGWAAAGAVARPRRAPAWPPRSMPADPRSGT